VEIEAKDPLFFLLAFYFRLAGYNESFKNELEIPGKSGGWILFAGPVRRAWL
jgi:hypothetical protein